MLAVTKQYRAWFSRTSESKWFRGILEGAHYLSRNESVSADSALQRWKKEKIETTLGWTVETNEV